MSGAARDLPRNVLSSAPGSFMLSGEHAVLRGQSALVAASQQRATVRLQRRNDQKITILSALGSCEMQMGAISVERPFHFAGAAIEALRSEGLVAGFDMRIETAMPPDVGLGSSAAVTVAVYAAVYAFVHGAIPDKKILWEACRDIIRSVQGRGSGADVAASVYGGVVLYEQNAGVLDQFVDNLPEFSLFYVGYKTPTADVIKIVDKKRLQSSALFHELDGRMDQATTSAAEAIRRGNLEALGLALHAGQEVMRGYGVCDENLETLITRLTAMDCVIAAKISGSGLGDCVLVLGAVPESAGIPFRQIPVAIDPQGVFVELK